MLEADQFRSREDMRIALRKLHPYKTSNITILKYHLREKSDFFFIYLDVEDHITQVKRRKRQLFWLLFLTKGLRLSEQK